MSSKLTSDNPRNDNNDNGKLDCISMSMFLITFLVHQHMHYAVYLSEISGLICFVIS